MKCVSVRGYYKVLLKLQNLFVHETVYKLNF